MALAAKVFLAIVAILLSGNVANAGELLDQYNRSLQRLITEQKKSPDQIIKFADPSGSLAKEVLDYDKVQSVLSEIDNEINQSGTLSSFTKNTLNTLFKYEIAFNAQGGSYETEYLAMIKIALAFSEKSSALIDREAIFLKLTNPNEAKIEDAVKKSIQAGITAIASSLAEKISTGKLSPHGTSTANEIIASINHPKAPKERVPAPMDTHDECALRIVQNGREILPLSIDSWAVFKLDAAEFKIEVTPLSCMPTMAMIGPNELSYITRTALAFSSSAVFGAGDSESSDILTEIGGSNPYTTLDGVINVTTHETAWAKQQYQQLCDTLSYCPTPIVAYSTAWPFLDATAKHEFRGYAEFKRFDNSSSMENVVGRVIPAVIYTSWKSINRRVGGFEYSSFRVLRPHGIILDFRQNVKNVRPSSHQEQAVEK